MPSNFAVTPAPVTVKTSNHAILWIQWTVNRCPIHLNSVILKRDKETLNIRFPAQSQAQNHYTIDASQLNAVLKYKRKQRQAEKFAVDSLHGLSSSSILEKIDQSRDSIQEIHQ